MSLCHGLDVEQSQSVAFHVVQVARRYTVELVEDVSLLFMGNADTLVGDGDFGLFVCPGADSTAMYVYFRFLVRVLDGIVYQITQYVAEMRTVRKDGHAVGIDVNGKAYWLVGLQFMLFDERIQ